MSPVKNSWSTVRPLALGFVALILLVFGIGVWSVNTNIAGAIVVSGVVGVQSNRQVVQHPDGGVIKEIFVDDGDVVVAGDILLRFEDKSKQSDLRVLTEQLFEIMVRKARLRAERDGAVNISFDDAFGIADTSTVYSELLQGQNNLFLARQKTLDREAALLKERKAQIVEQIAGTMAQVEALKTQRVLLAEELVDEKSLLGKGLSQANTIRALQRETARIQGLNAELVATIAQRRGQIAEIEIEILRLRSRLREEAITTLRNLRYQEIEIRESRLSLLERLQRMDVRAPVSGIILNKQYHANRAVVRPAETILTIIPQDTPLIVAIHIPAIHIDQVRVGQPTSLHFAAFDTRTTPVILGQVTKISPDVFIDESTGEHFYSAEVVPASEELAKLEALYIRPGMPAYAFLKTADRTPLEYLVKPLADYFNKSFREI